MMKISQNALKKAIQGEPFPGGFLLRRFSLATRMAPETSTHERDTRIPINDKDLIEWSILLPFKSLSYIPPSLRPLPSLPPLAPPLTPPSPISLPPEKLIKELIKEVEPRKSRATYQSHMQEELGLSQRVADQIFLLYGPALLKNYQNIDDFREMCRFAGEFFTAEELTHNAFPFSLSFYELYNRVLIYKELGFRSINPSMVEHHSEIFPLSVNELRNHFGQFIATQDCILSICKSLNIVNEKKAIEDKILSKYGSLDKVTVDTVRYLCVAKYLSQRLKFDITQTGFWCRRAHRSLCNIALEEIVKIVDILADQYKYPDQRIVHNSLFAYVNRWNLQSIYESLKELATEEEFVSLTKHPSLLKMEANVLIENFKFIKANCTDGFCSRSTDLLRLPHKELKSIFNELTNNPDIKALNLSAFGIDYLALNKDKIFGRIQELKSHEIPLKFVPLPFFASSEQEFNKFVNTTLKNPELRTRFYLEENFGVDYETVKDRIKLLPGGKPKAFSSENAKKIVGFLISVNVPREKIIESVNLIMYDYKLVKSAYFSACTKYPTTLHADPNFFEHIFSYIVNKHSDSK